MMTPQQQHDLEQLKRAAKTVRHWRGESMTLREYLEQRLRKEDLTDVTQ